MKKLLLGSLALIFFSISILIFQISCKKDAIAQPGSNYILPAATITKLGGIIVGDGLSVTNNGTLSVTPTTGGLTQIGKLIFKKITGSAAEIWTANYDGTNAVKVNISLPLGIVYSDDMNPIMSPNGQKIFFTAGLQDLGGDLYACDANGSNVVKIVDKGGASNNIILGSAY